MNRENIIVLQQRIYSIALHTGNYYNGIFIFYHYRDIYNVFINIFIYST